MEETKNYIQQNKTVFLDELLDLLRIPSVSADSKFLEDVRKTALFIQDKLIKAGVDKSEIHETKGHPIVYAEKIINKDLPTILVYGHYDVQPADPYELWDSEPFDPVIKKTTIH